jgi:hypothetical protein
MRAATSGVSLALAVATAVLLASWLPAVGAWSSRSDEEPDVETLHCLTPFEFAVGYSSERTTPTALAVMRWGTTFGRTDWRFGFTSSIFEGVGLGAGHHPQRAVTYLPVYLHALRITDFRWRRPGAGGDVGVIDFFAGGSAWCQLEGEGGPALQYVRAGIRWYETRDTGTRLGVEVGRIWVSRDRDFDPYDRTTYFAVTVSMEGWVLH